MKRLLLVLVFLLWLTANSWGQDNFADLRSVTQPANALWLSTLDLSKMTTGWGTPHVDMSVDGNPIKLHGIIYPHGVGTHAESEITIDLKGVVQRFQAMVGVDDEVNDQGSLTFSVFADDRQLLETPILKGGDDPYFINIDLTNVRTLRLRIGNANGNISCDHGDWAGALLWLIPDAKEQPVSITPPPPPVLSTVEPIIASKDDIAMTMNSPMIVGATPTRPFQYLIAAVGPAPIVYSTENLPEGLALDATTGLITGKIAIAGDYKVLATASSANASVSRTITISAGAHKLGQTPPMGWNTGRILNRRINVTKVKEAADTLVKAGLVSRGYQYILLGDGWQGQRSVTGELQANPNFGDMKELADYLHARGLKLGIFSTPSEKTVRGAPGSAGYEVQDAKTFAAWGVDYLRYDWGTCKNPDIKAPYQVMSDALQGSDRDIFYSISQFGMGNVWEWGAKVGGNSWQVGQTVSDTWAHVSTDSINLEAIGYAGPGHWNDYDSLKVGNISRGGAAIKSKLTPNEQLSHLTLMSMISAPLLLGCNLNSLDTYTLNLISNTEVLAVNQDTAGTPPTRLNIEGDGEVWSRQLVDGTLAVALFNRGVSNTQVLVRWTDLKLTGLQQVRNLWQRTELGNYPDGYSTIIPGHGVVLLRVGTPKD